jgi:hypothetical protein
MRPISSFVGRPDEGTHTTLESGPSWSTTTARTERGQGGLHVHHADAIQWVEWAVTGEVR